MIPVLLAALASGPATLATYAPDRIEIQLRAGAAAVARAQAPGTLQGTAGTVRLGLPAIERAVARRGAARFAPEFRGEIPPAPGSRETDFTAFYIVRWDRGVPLDQTLAELRALPEIATADPIGILPVAVAPNDSLFPSSYWFAAPDHRDIHAPEAWDVTTGDSTILVAVLDTGVLPYHPDLGGTTAGYAGQIWTNEAEANGVPGVDDDGNGVIDDVHGYDFVDRPSDGVVAGEDYSVPDNDPNDFAGHGTLVAGIIGARTNDGIGVAGTAWNVRILPVRVGWSAVGAELGLVDMAFVAQGIRYATRSGASVINCSFATRNTSGLFAAAAAATRAGVTIVAASGNGGQPHDLATRDDVISVAATGPGDLVAPFSNLGDYVDLAAPGVAIASTFLVHTGTDSVGLRQPAYAAFDGTSFSAPIVAGGAALVQAARRAHGERPLIPQGMLLRLAETTDSIASINPGVTGYGSGRLNLFRALTDRPTSTATRAWAATIGAPLVMPPEGAEPRVAYLTEDRKLLVMSGQGPDTLNLTNLPAPPLPRLAGAALPEGTLATAPPQATRAVRAPHEQPFVLFAATATGKVLGMDEFGNPLPGWPVSAGGILVRPAQGPALGDLDGDGVIEIACGADDGNVFAWNLDGSLRSGFPVAAASPVTVSVAMADLDLDGADDIVVAASGGDVHALRGDGGELPGWPVQVGTDPRAPVVGRLGHDPHPVVLVAVGDSLIAFAADGARRFAVGLESTVAQDPALGDLNGDGADEIVLALATPVVVALDSTGAVVPGWPADLFGASEEEPVVGPVSAAGTGVAVTDGNGLAGFRADGSRITGFPRYALAGRAPTLVDIDGDGATELLAGTGVDSVLYVFDLGAGSAAAGFAGAWPTARADFARRGSRAPGPTSAVRDLHVVEVGATRVTLGFRAPGNAGAEPRPVTFTVRGTALGSAHDPGTRELATIAAAGDSIVFVFDGIERESDYGFVETTSNGSGFVSAPSNTVNLRTALGPPLESVPGPGLAPVARPSGVPVDLLWRGAGGSQWIDVFDVTGRHIRRLSVGGGNEGVTTWNGRDDAGVRVPAGLYFARLTSGSVHVQTRVVLLP